MSVKKVEKRTRQLPVYEAIASMTSCQGLKQSILAQKLLLMNSKLNNNQAEIQVL